MAIKKEIATNFGISVVDAYHRVDRVSVSKTGMVYIVRSYADLNAQPLREETYCCDYDINGCNPLAQAYFDLKLKPEFLGAIDC